MAESGGCLLITCTQADQKVLRSFFAAEVKLVLQIE
jgi:hypothetical protein